MLTPETSTFVSVRRDASANKDTWAADPTRDTRWELGEGARR